VFDDAATRQRDVAVLIHEAHQLGYPVRYWWLSEAMELQGSPPSWDIIDLPIFTTLPAPFSISHAKITADRIK